MTNKGMKTERELVCKHRDAGVVCKREGTQGTYGDCTKCGWSPETEARRKEKIREARCVSI